MKPPDPPREVYVVTMGEYADYQIDAVFLDRSKAEEYIRDAEPGVSMNRYIEVHPIVDAGDQREGE